MLYDACDFSIIVNQKNAEYLRHMDDVVELSAKGGKWSFEADWINIIEQL